MLADALAKGVFILGPEAGMALIERSPGVEGVIVSATNEVLVSSGLKDKLTVLARPPTLRSPRLQTPSFRFYISLDALS